MRKIRKGNDDRYADQMWRGNLTLALAIIGTGLLAAGLIGIEHIFFTR